MKKTLLITVTLLAVMAAGIIYAGEKAPPETLTFDAKPGAVTFTHAKHAEAVKGDCKVCHPGLFKAEKAPLGFKEGMHKPAETNKTSCGACHTPGGKAFETKGNCGKCHVKK